MSRLSSAGSDPERPDGGLGARWALGRRALTIFALALGIALAAGPAPAGQISCAKSGVDFDRTAFPHPFDFVCKADVRAADASATGDQAIVDRAFGPAGSEINGVLMSSPDGRYGNAFLITARAGAMLGEPGLRSAMEAKVRLFGDKAGSVVWGDQSQAGDYAVDSFRLSLPQSGSDGGARQCIGFVRYVDGNAASHAQRVIGSYCETGVKPLDNDAVMHVLDAVIVRLDLQ